MKNKHTFHIPVMGIGFTIDTPLKVALYGIDSVISLVDDMLIERMRKLHCENNSIPYEEIPKTDKDHRAKRITSYLNLLSDLLDKKIDEFKQATFDKAEELKKHFELLPGFLSQKFDAATANKGRFNFEEMKKYVSERLSLGSIDVNIMTKVDKENFVKNEKLPIQFNDAHAALRGFAKSKLNSSLILSAGMNPSLFSYFEEFDDFYPDQNGQLNKKIILKVSDYRSALIQGKILAKKGIWISEYRIESGLNCGGHAFATEGYLMGPILAEFRDKRMELIETLQELYADALALKKKHLPKIPLAVKFTAQGGVGTAMEHELLITQFNIDSVGWGSPFLLVPEATNVDAPTLQKLEKAKEDDLYLSDISPLGVPFNSLRGNTKDEEKYKLINKGRPGSSCPKKYVSLNKEFNKKGSCTASRAYQHLKIKELEAQSLDSETHASQVEKITAKSCTCVGLGTSALLVNNLDTKVEGEGVSICPGPNLAYFSKKMSLAQMVNHIYGRSDVIDHQDRPNMFIKELRIYLDYLKEKIAENKSSLNRRQKKYFLNFSKNLDEGILFYNSFFNDMKIEMTLNKQKIIRELEDCKKQFDILNAEILGLCEVQL